PEPEPEPELVAEPEAQAIPPELTFDDLPGDDDTIEEYIEQPVFEDEGSEIDLDAEWPDQGIDEASLAEGAEIDEPQPVAEAVPEPKPEPKPKPKPEPRRIPEPEPPKAPKQGSERPKVRASDVLPPPDKAAKLFEYLRGLSDELPAEKRREFDASGLKDKMDGLIDKLREAADRESAPPPVVPREPGVGLLAAGEARRRAMDPRRAPTGRRKSDRRERVDRRGGADRRSSDDRRNNNDRRGQADRRSNDRRTPPPKMEIEGKIDDSVAPVTRAPDGTPIEIAGIRVSPRLARLIEIIRREKLDGRK
ncbi:MAG: hypothetical protein Q8M76_02630, partial [Spirochaetaceae bacterium]|nr:hypothetical protein [Spirochaetaceae bacterium]